MKKILLTIVALTAFVCGGFAQTDKGKSDQNVGSQETIEQIIANSAKNAEKLEKMFEKDKDMTSELITLDALYAAVTRAATLSVEDSKIAKAVVEKNATTAQLKQYKNNTVEIANLLKDTPPMIQAVPSELALVKDAIKAKPLQAVKLGKGLMKATKMFKNSKEAIDIIKEETEAQAKIMKTYGK